MRARIAPTAPKDWPSPSPAARRCRRCSSGLYVYRASPKGLGIALLLRWAATAAALAVALHWLPEPQGFLELCLYIALVLAGFAFGVVLLGERDLFRRSYWSMRRA